nr:hypothetical protein [Tanacetum cinerariifolium]
MPKEVIEKLTPLWEDTLDPYDRLKVEPHRTGRSARIENNAEDGGIILVHLNIRTPRCHQCSKWGHNMDDCLKKKEVASGSPTKSPKKVADASKTTIEHSSQVEKPVSDEIEQENKVTKDSKYNDARIESSCFSTLNGKGANGEDMDEDNMEEGEVTNDDEEGVFLRDPKEKVKPTLEPFVSCETRLRQSTRIGSRENRDGV